MTNNPLLDSQFLYDLDHNRNRTTFARITSLTTEGYPVERIEGVVTAGTITLDGSSAVRRVCNLTLTTGKLNINNIYWSLTTRIKVEIGIENNVIVYDNNGNKKNYQDIYPEIIWFPQGVYLLTDFKTQAQVNNYIITIQGKDKMCLLNGDIGGVFNAETQLDTERIQQEDGTWVDEKRSIAYILREMIHHYAQEPFHNIVIKDIDTLSLQVLYNNATTLYYVENVATGEITDIFCADDISATVRHKHYFYYEMPTLEVNFNSLLEDFIFYTPVDEDNGSLIPSAPTYLVDNEYNKYRVQKINKGEDLGYQLIETYYPDELIAGVGETVVSILDKIVKTFGNFEYFYNLDGQFVFQEKQTYINTKWNSMIKMYKETDEAWIQPQQVSTQVKYHFEGSKIVSAYQNSPNIGNIKNDFTVWGKKKLNSGIEIPIHMRYAIDVKPKFYASYPKTERIISTLGNEKIIGPFQDIYLTSDQYKELEQKIAESKAKPSAYTLTKKAPPDYIYAAMEGTGEDPNACWWTVADWAEYYKFLTGAYPEGIMSRFCRTCFTIPIVTPDGRKIDLSHTAIMDVYADSGNVFNYTNISAPLILGAKMQSYRGWSGLQHGLNGCGHTFDIFLSLSHVYNVDSWCYKPYLPNGGEIFYDMPTADGYRFHVVDWREIIYQMAKDYYLHNHDDDYEVMLNRNNTLPDFNIRLFERGHTGYEQYYHDIEGFWRLLYAPQEYVDNYDIDKAKIPAYTINADDFYETIIDEHGIETRGNFIGPWNKQVIEQPSNLVFWFDFFDAEGIGLNQFSIPAIGDRPKNESNDSIRALIYKDIPDVVLIEEEQFKEYDDAGRLLDGYNYYFLDSTLRQFIEDNKIRISTRSVTAQESIDDLLYNNAYCNETINITSVPIYYLEPNTIISARDEARMVHGYYIINKITLPLDYKGTMQITAIKVPERVY